MPTAKINELASELTSTIFTQLSAQIEKQVKADIAQRLAQIDIQKTVYDYVALALSNVISTIDFPDGSIPGAAVNLSDFSISGNNVTGGIIKNFGSTGIQDNATNCVLTIMDDATVVENKFITSEANIKGNLTLEGDLVVLGEVSPDSPFYKDIVEHAAGIVRMSLDDGFFSQYATKVFDRIKADGIDLNKLTLNGAEIVKGNALAYNVTETNIQKLGELKTVRVLGDSDFGNSVHVRNKRLGINTEEPSAALSVWDEECAFLVRKLQKDTIMVGSDRPQRIVLSSNNKSNVVLEPDGSVRADRLKLGTVTLSTSTTAPAHVATRGEIVFNDSPVIGGPVGWVSLGGANWGSFGNIS